MKKTSSFKKTSIGLIALALIGVSGYNIFNTTMVARADTATALLDATTTPVGQDILNLLSTFQTVNIDSTFFSSPLFQNLKDYSVAVPTEQVGRANPFAQIGSDGGVVQALIIATTSSSKVKAKP